MEVANLASIGNSPLSALETQKPTQANRTRSDTTAGERFMVVPGSAAGA